jgi:hypothetical protein
MRNTGSSITRKMKMLLRFGRRPSGRDTTLPRFDGGSASTSPFSRPARRSLTLRSACSPSHLCDPLHRRLRSLRYLHDRSDCYRPERKLPGGTTSHWGIAPSTAHVKVGSDRRVPIRQPVELRAGCEVPGAFLHPIDEKERLHERRLLAPQRARCPCATRTGSRAEPHGW